MENQHVREGRMGSPISSNISLAFSSALSPRGSRPSKRTKTTLSSTSFLISLFETAPFIIFKKAFLQLYRTRPLPLHKHSPILMHAGFLLLEAPCGASASWSW